MTVDLIDGRYMYLCVGLGLGLGVFPMFGLYCRKLPRLVNHAIIAVARYRSYCLGSKITEVRSINGQE